MEKMSSSSSEELMLGRQHVVDFFVEKVALLLAHRDELPDLVVLFFDRKRHGRSRPAPCSPRSPRGPPSAATRRVFSARSASCASPLAPASRFWISAMRALSGCRRSSRTQSSAESALRRARPRPRSPTSAAPASSSSPARTAGSVTLSSRRATRLRRAQERRRAQALEVRVVSSSSAISTPAAPCATSASSHRSAGSRTAGLRHRRAARGRLAPPPRGRRVRPESARRSSSRAAPASSPPRSATRGEPGLPLDRVRRCARARASPRRGTPPCPRASRCRSRSRARRISHSMASGASSRRFAVRLRPLGLEVGVGVVALRAAPRRARGGPPRAARRGSCAPPSAPPRPGRSSGRPSPRSAAGAARATR